MMNITPFSPAERKALMEELFPLKRTARDYDLRQDMTLADLVRNDITREAEELFRAWKDAEKETREEE